jgi:hypothetical protein
MRLFLLTLAGLLVGGTVVAPRGFASGVVEINQSRALAGGVTPGDAAGFPVTISLPGSYRLTSLLDVRGAAEPENTTAIDVAASDVTIDLAGFRINGPVGCSNWPAPVVCGPAGSGVGIRVSSASFRNLTVRNGVIHGMGNAGIRCQRGCVVENVHSRKNAGAGISQTNGPGAIRDCIVHRNGGEGIRWMGVITGNFSTDNGGVGIFSQPGSTLIGNTSARNAGNGVRCATCLMIDNSINANQGFGVDLSTGAYGRNQLLDNALGATSGSGVQVDVNVCPGGACP